MTSLATAQDVAAPQYADFASHRIEGFTREGNIPFSVPLFTQIAENLWMGGCPRGDAPQFDTIIDLYDQERYFTHVGQVRIAVKLMDSHDLPDADLLSDLVAFARLAKERGPTLIHCQAGLNRSGLLTALVLMSEGATADEAITKLRERRCDAVLCNKAFEALILGQHAGSTPEVAATSQ